MDSARTRNQPRSQHGFISPETRAVSALRLTCCSVLHPSRCAVRTSWHLGRESQFSISFYFLVRFFTRPTNHPRHAASGAFPRSKPVRPQNDSPTIRAFASAVKGSGGSWFVVRWWFSRGRGIMQTGAYESTRQFVIWHSALGSSPDLNLSPQLGYCCD